MWKCRICGKEYDKIEDVMKCEQGCLPSYVVEREKKYNTKLEEDMKVLNAARNNYIKIRDKMIKKYPEDYKKFIELFGVDNINSIRKIHIDKDAIPETSDKIKGKSTDNPFIDLLNLLGMYQ